MRLEHIVFDTKIDEKSNKLFLFCINVVILLVCVLPGPTGGSVWKYAVAIALLAILYAVIMTGDEYNPICVYIPLIIAVDLLVYLCLQYKGLFKCYAPNSFAYSNVLYYSGSGDCKTLLIIGSILAFIGIIAKKISWVGGVGGTAIVSAIIIAEWGNGSFSNLAFAPGGKTLLTLTVAIGIILTIFLQFVSLTYPSKRGMAVIPSIIILIGALVFLSYESMFVVKMAVQWDNKLLALSDGLFAWWKVILVVILLLVPVVPPLLNTKDRALSVDAYTFIILAELILGTRVLMISYFSYNYLLIFALIIGTFKCMKNNYSSKASTKTLHMDSKYYLIAQYVLFCLFVFFFEKNLWINAIITAAFVVIYNRLADKSKEERALPLCYTTMVLVVLETAAWMLRKKYSVGGMIAVAVLLIVSVFALSLINKKSPDNRIPPKSCSVAICVFLSILCVLAAGKAGTKISIESDDPSHVVVDMKAKGKENSIDNVYFYWTDKQGHAGKNHQLIENGTKKTESTRIAIKEERLTVVAVDSNGIETAECYWTPHWMITEK